MTSTAVRLASECPACWHRRVLHHEHGCGAPDCRCADSGSDREPATGPASAEDPHDRVVRLRHQAGHHAGELVWGCPGCRREADGATAAGVLCGIRHPKRGTDERPCIECLHDVQHCRRMCRGGGAHRGDCYLIAWDVDPWE